MTGAIVLTIVRFVEPKNTTEELGTMRQSIRGMDLEHQEV